MEKVRIQFLVWSVMEDDGRLKGGEEGERKRRETQQRAGYIVVASEGMCLLGAIPLLWCLRCGVWERSLLFCAWRREI